MPFKTPASNYIYVVVSSDGFIAGVTFDLKRAEMLLDQFQKPQGVKYYRISQEWIFTPVEESENAHS